jgi:hypothetical protein
MKKLEDLALDVVGCTVARVSVEEHMANYQAARALLGSAKKGATKSAVKKAKPKKSAKQQRRQVSIVSTGLALFSRTVRRGSIPLIYLVGFSWDSKLIGLW